MKTIDRFFILLATFSPWFFSCNPILYSNVGQNVPMFQNKDELVLNGGYVLTTVGEYSDADGVGVQAAYAVTDNLAAMGSFYSMSGIKDPDYDEWEGRVLISKQDLVLMAQLSQKCSYMKFLEG